MAKENHMMESPHGMPVTDIGSDGLGKYVATCSEDSTVRVFAVCADGRLEHIATLEAHEGPVSRIAWAPYSQHRSELVSISEDGQVILWDDISKAKVWVAVYTTKLPAIPWCVAWAPAPFGRIFAVGCEDGTVKVFTGREQQWEVSEFQAHTKACSGVSWAPFLPTGALSMMPPTLTTVMSIAEDGTPRVTPYPLLTQRVVTCGEDGKVNIWQLAPPRASDGDVEGERNGTVCGAWTWTKQELAADVPVLSWREVAWAPNVGLPFDYIAAGSDSGYVVVWSRDGLDGPWRSCVLKQFEEGICKLSWSQVGTLLMVSCADGTITMWKECVTGEWEIATQLSHPNQCA